MADNAEIELLRAAIARFLQGDSIAFRAVKTRISWYVTTFSQGLDGEREQIVADVLGILTENLRNNRFRGDSLRALNFYIYGIVRNRSQNLHRKDSRIERNGAPLDTIADDASPADENMARRDLVNKIVRMLDDKNARLLLMKFERGMSDQEIAEELGMTKNAVSTAICRCIRKVQNMGIVRELR